MRASLPICCNIIQDYTNIRGSMKSIQAWCFVVIGVPKCSLTRPYPHSCSHRFVNVSHACDSLIGVPKWRSLIRMCPHTASHRGVNVNYYTDVMRCCVPERS